MVEIFYHRPGQGHRLLAVVFDARLGRLLGDMIGEDMAIIWSWRLRPGEEPTRCTRS